MRSRSNSAKRRLDAVEARRLGDPLTSEPQACGYAATGWRVPLLRTGLATGGWSASTHTIRCTLHRLGWV